ncbi:hypothetical protein BJY52DRAFT_248458 [Lactarius psammicola]|nr:hypothetical protein BJY52DRAFT_248458 [Lactarius psammicola]
MFTAFGKLFASLLVPVGPIKLRAQQQGARHWPLSSEPVHVGRLEIEESGAIHRFGSPENSETHVHIMVVNDFLLETNISVGLYLRVYAYTVTDSCD